MSNMLRTTLLLAALTGLIVGLGQMLGGSQGAVIALVLAAVMNLGSYWFSDRIVIKMYGNVLQNLFSTHPPLEQRLERLQRVAGELGLAAR